MELQTIFNFLKFTNDFRKTERAIYAISDNRNENDVEHSFQLAIFAWYLADINKLDLDNELMLKFALIHDMDETFDGDKHIFDTAGRVDKEEKAKMARERIGKMFPNWNGYKELSEKYTKLDCEESKFIYALDKVLPVLDIIIDGGRSWHREKTTLQMLVENKRPKVATHEVAKELWTETEKYMGPRELELFGKLSS